MSERPRCPMVFVGVHQFTVRYEPGLADEGVLGRILLLQNVIELRPNMSEQMERQTLMHEVLHAILFLGGIKQHSDQELDVLANGVLQVKQQNPNLFE